MKFFIAEHKHFLPLYIKHWCEIIGAIDQKETQKLSTLSTTKKKPTDFFFSYVYEYCDVIDVHKTKNNDFGYQSV